MRGVKGRNTTQPLKKKEEILPFATNRTNLKGHSDHFVMYKNIESLCSNLKLTYYCRSINK